MICFDAVDTKCLRPHACALHYHGTMPPRGGEDIEI